MPYVTDLGLNCRFQKLRFVWVSKLSHDKNSVLTKMNINEWLCLHYLNDVLPVSGYAFHAGIIYYFRIPGIGLELAMEAPAGEYPRISLSYRLVPVLY